MSRVPPHAFLTALSPLPHAAQDPHQRLPAVRAALAAHLQSESPFRDCPMAHMVRLQVIDTLRPAMGDVGAAPLGSAWLLWVAELDGPVDDFLDCLYRVGADFVHSVWGRCTGYPPYAGAVFFRRYIARCRIGGELPYAAFDATVGASLRALAAKQAVVDFAVVTQGLDDAALFATWRARRALLSDPPVDKPGAL